MQGDVLFSSLGTSKKQAGGKAQQWRVDHDYQLMDVACAMAQLAKSGKQGMTVVNDQEILLRK